MFQPPQEREKGRHSLRQDRRELPRLRPDHLDPSVVQRLRQHGLGITAKRVLTEQACIAFGGMSHFIRIGPDGAPVIDLKDCTPEDLDRLVDVQVDSFIDGQGDQARGVRRIKFKRMDKRRSLEFLGMHLGLFKEPVPDTADRAIDAIRYLILARTPMGSKAPIAQSRQRGVAGA